MMHHKVLFTTYFNIWFISIKDFNPIVVFTEKKNKNTSLLRKCHPFNRVDHRREFCSYFLKNDWHQWQILKTHPKRRTGIRNTYSRFHMCLIQLLSCFFSEFEHLLQNRSNPQSLILFVLVYIFSRLPTQMSLGPGLHRLDIGNSL